jgi:hypothetical protein
MLISIRRIVVTLAAIIAAGLLFVNVYNSIVDAPNWGSNIPASIGAAREYFAVRNPGDFYRYLSPANQVVTLVAVVLVWPLGWPMRLLTFAALLISVGADAMTFGYFYPRNDIMFNAVPMADDATLRAAWTGWSSMNWVRSGLVLANVILDHIVLFRISNKS